MSEGYEIHVVSNTHWDREWLYDFQETRMMLVEFLDGLLDILDTEPSYKGFLLDSQTVPLEDYLEVRPENVERVRKHVSDGRLSVGPWYTCPEGFIVNGESLVRNLLYGHRVAKKFGKVMKVGHTPFSYGQNSQMPQIYSGFGIDSILFYHGVSHEDVENEFIFEGADGTQILGSQMSSFARYNYYFGVYRHMVYNTAIDEREHFWNKGGLPFHLASPESSLEHHFLLDVKQHYYKENLKACLEKLKEKEIGVSTTRYLAFMMGHDSSIGDRVELRILEDAQGLLPGDKIFHSTLPDLIGKVKGAVKNLRVLKGERRVPKIMSGRLHLYSDVLSSRTRVKRLNARAEMILQRRAEPWAAIAALSGAEYPQSLLDIAWKFLLQSHAHDSIAGSGVDDIEKDVTHRLRQAINISRGVARRGLQSIVQRIDNSDATVDDVLLAVFNPSPFERSDVVTVALDLPTPNKIKEFSFLAPDQKEIVPVQIASRRPHHAVFNHAGDGPNMMTCERVVAHFDADNIPALGYATYRLVKQGDFLKGGMVSGLNTMENEFLRAKINKEGTIDLLDKQTGHEFTGLHYFEDSGEAGHAWMHIEPATDRILTSHGFPAQVSLEENGPLLTRYRIDYHMRVPARLEENGSDPWQRLDGSGSASTRSEETCELLITSLVTLRKGAKSLEVVTRFDNKARNHRLRVLFPSRLNTKTCHVETAFDVVEREVVYGPESPWFGGENATFPMHRFVDVNDGSHGLAILNDGLREYQVTENADRAIALTLLRAYEVSLTTVSKRWEPHPEMVLSQSPGEHEFCYCIYPHADGWDKGGVYREIEASSLKLEPAQIGCHEGDLPKKQGFLSLDNTRLSVTALKRSEDGNLLLVRVFNPGGENLEGKISSSVQIKSACLLTLEELKDKDLSLSGNEVKITVPSRKIVTVGLEMVGI